MAITVTIQPSNTDGEDCYIDSGAATTNYNRQSTALLNSTRAALIRFNLANYIPLKAKLIGVAQVNIYKTTASHADTSTSVLLSIVKRNFVYNQATWNIYATGDNWGTAGCKGTDDCYGGWAQGAQTRGAWWNYSNSTGAEWLTFYVPASAFGNLGDVGSGYQGGRVIFVDPAADTGRTVTIAMCGNATAANRPKLTITYEPYHKIFPIVAGLGQVR